MRDDHRGLVASYREPRSASELAAFVELAVLDLLGRTMSGGVGENGGDFSLGIDDPYPDVYDGDVAIVVMPFGEWLDLKRMAGGRGEPDRRPYWLTPQEAALVEARREMEMAHANRAVAAKPKRKAGPKG